MRLTRTGGVAALAAAVLAAAVLAGSCARGGGGGPAPGGGARSGAPGGATGGDAGAVPYDPVRYGGQLFGNMCAGCHGEGGRGGTAVSLARPELAQKYPTDDALLRRIEEGDPATGMPPCPVGKLMPLQKKALVAYLRSLWR